MTSCFLNTHPFREDQTYKYTHGDKETFWLGFDIAGSGYTFLEETGGIIGVPDGFSGSTEVVDSDNISNDEDDMEFEYFISSNMSDGDIDMNDVGMHDKDRQKQKRPPYRICGSQIAHFIQPVSKCNLDQPKVWWFNIGMMKDKVRGNMQPAVLTHAMREWKVGMNVMQWERVDFGWFCLSEHKGVGDLTGMLITPLDKTELGVVDAITRIYVKVYLRQ